MSGSVSKFNHVLFSGFSRYRTLSADSNAMWHMRN
jgi:hypothetical protein